MKQREWVLELFSTALQAVDPKEAVRRVLRCEDGKVLAVGDQIFDLDRYDKIAIMGSGKAALKMGEAAGEVLDGKFDKGLLITNQADSIPGFTCLQASHPISDERSLNAARQLLDSLHSLTSNDLLIFLLSGGNSALCELPYDSISLSDYQQAVRTLLESGAVIQELNTIRKHLSQVKGGRLAEATQANGAVLVLSDVLDDDLSSIGSGPFAPDATTFEECWVIIEHYGLRSKLPDSVCHVLEEGKRGNLPETPKEESSKISHHMVGSNHLALEAMREACEARGIQCVLHPEPIQGEARDWAVRTLKEICQERVSAPTCHLFGGESTVTVRGSGKGGRNHEMALAALQWIGEREGVTFLSAGTDGLDGMADAAGAVADTEGFRKAKSLGLDIDDYLARNDSGSFFQATGDNIVTGSTGTNVMDVVVIMIEPV